MFVSIILILCCYSSVTSLTVNDWYWRDYKGLIPSDALPTGLNSKGQKTYLAQIVVPAKYNTNISPVAIVPGTVTIGEAIAVGSYFDIIRTSINLKILCTNSPARYSWHSPEVVPIGCSYVVGGGEVSHGKELDATYIGRVVVDNQVLIGKLLVKTIGQIPLLHYVHNGVEKWTYNYKALFFCYNNYNNTQLQQN